MAERSGKQTPSAPEISETKLREMKVDELRGIAREHAISGASTMKKEELVEAISEAARRGGRFTREDSGGDAGAGPDAGRVRTGPETSKSIKYSQEVTSPEEDPERPGRSLVTTNHEVIKQWAEARGARPATVEGTEHGDHLGVLTFDFGDASPNLRHVSWEEWFETFDARRLNFIYQEERSDGRQSNFFRLESPEREDA
jgi:hypothetical protein